MEQNNKQVHIHLHVHEGASPDAVRAAAEALGDGLEPGVSTTAHDPASKPGADDRHAEYVRRAYTESEWNAKPLLEFLANNPDRLIPYTEVTEALGFPSSRSLPGLLGSFTRRADHRYEGIQPFDRRDTLDGWCLYMSKENAAIINEARS